MSKTITLSRAFVLRKKINNVMVDMTNNIGRMNAFHRSQEELTEDQNRFCEGKTYLEYFEYYKENLEKFSELKSNIERESAKTRHLFLKLGSYQTMLSTYERMLHSQKYSKSVIEEYATDDKGERFVLKTVLVNCISEDAGTPIEIISKGMSEIKAEMAKIDDEISLENASLSITISDELFDWAHEMSIKTLK